MRDARIIERPCLALALTALLAGCRDSGRSAPVTPTAPLPVAQWLDLDEEHPGQRLQDPRSGIVFRRVEPGEYRAGGTNYGELTPRTVRVTRPFLLAETELTVSAWRRFARAASVDDTPALGRDDALPMPVSWDSAVQFCDYYGYRLPTEAEWELACLAGRPQDAAEFVDALAIEESAWVHTNAGDDPRPVAGRKANPLGFHDMVGNVWEWCSDRSSITDTARPDPDIDPTGPEHGKGRVLRGGSWFSIPLPQPRSRAGDFTATQNDFYGARPACDLP